jgi:hypothetical protein
MRGLIQCFHVNPQFENSMHCIKAKFKFSSVKNCSNKTPILRSRKKEVEKVEQYIVCVITFVHLSKLCTKVSFWAKRLWALIPVHTLHCNESFLSSSSLSIAS